MPDIFVPSLKSSLSDFLHVDRTMPPYYGSPDWSGGPIHPELERCGPSDYDASKLDLWAHPTGTINIQENYEELLRQDLLALTPSLQDAQAFQHHPALYHRIAKGRGLMLWRSIVFSRVQGKIWVPCIWESGSQLAICRLTEDKNIPAHVDTRLLVEYRPGHHELKQARSA